MPDALERHLREEGNRALERAALVALLLAVLNAVLLPVALLLAFAEGLWLPWVFTLACAAACALLYGLARRRMLHGPTAWVVLLGFTSLPTAFLLAMELVLPSGAATFLNGPLTLLYFVLVATTGCLLNPRLTLASGAVAALGYGTAAWVALPQLQQLQSADALMRQDLTEFPVYLFKCLMLLFAGAVCAAIALVGRRLAQTVLREAEAKVAVHRLFGTYVSEQVAERLIAGGDEGQRVDAVILFCDLRGFTAYSEQAEPEAIVARLNDYLEAMVGAIRAHGGVVDKFVGDEVMAVFGGLVPIDHPADAAVAAADEMALRLQALNQRWSAEGLPAFSHGVGIHAGEVIQGAIGSPERRDYTVIGDAVNTASRVEGLTKQEGAPILVSQAVIDRLRPDARARFRSLGSRPLKGRTQAITLYAPLADSAAFRSESK